MGKTILKSCSIPFRIGFDKISVKMFIAKVDWGLFDSVLSYNTGLKAASCRVSKEKLHICNGVDEGHWFSRIWLKLDHYDVTIKSKYSDEAEVEVTIPSMPGFEELGNIHNLSCDEMKTHIRALICETKEYGIYFDDERAVIQKAEINLNLVNGNSDEPGDDLKMLTKTIMPLCVGQSKNAYSYTIKKPQKLLRDIEVQGQTMTFTVPNDVIETVSCNNGNTKILVYDKSAETRDKAKGTIKRMLTQVTRIECKVSGKELESALTECDLFKLEQIDLEKAFATIVNSLIKASLKKVYDEWNHTLEKLFEAVDISREPQKWKENLCLWINQLTKDLSYQLIVTNADISRYVSYMHGSSISKNRARLANDLIREIRKWCLNVIVTDQDCPTILLEKLSSATGKEYKTIEYEYNLL